MTKICLIFSLLNKLSFSCSIFYFGINRGDTAYIYITLLALTLTLFLFFFQLKCEECDSITPEQCCYMSGSFFHVGKEVNHVAKVIYIRGENNFSFPFFTF